MLPSYCPVKAIQFPSGENTGSPSCPPVVSCRASPPPRGTLHKYPPYTKPICVRLRVGECTSNGESSAAAAKPVNPNNIVIISNNRARIVPPSKPDQRFICFTSVKLTSNPERLLRQFPVATGAGQKPGSLMSSIKGEVKKKHISFGWSFFCFSAHLIERDLF